MANERLRAIILDVVETQLKTKEPLIVSETLERLMNTGYTRDESVRLIGAALAEEIYAILTTQKPYDETRYSEALNKLE